MNWNWARCTFLFLHCLLYFFGIFDHQATEKTEKTSCYFVWKEERNNSMQTRNFIWLNDSLATKQLKNRRKKKEREKRKKLAQKQCNRELFPRYFWRMKLHKVLSSNLDIFFSKVKLLLPPPKPIYIQLSLQLQLHRDFAKEKVNGKSRNNSRTSTRRGENKKKSVQSQAEMERRIFGIWH
jgi:hypothetical protein